MAALVQQQNILHQMSTIVQYIYAARLEGLKKCIRVREVQPKSMKGKMSKISSLTHYFLLEKKYRNDNRFLTEIFNGECLHCFSIWKSLGTSRAIFLQRHHPGLLHAKSP